MRDIICGDCLSVMPILPANSVDSILTDPPYGLDFMGKSWDHGVPGVEFWQAALRVAKPGAILMAFGGTRTFHRLACAIEDAGWELRDTACWLYGSGFPKSLDISKAIDRAADIERNFAPHTRVDTGFRFQSGGTESVSPCTPAAKLWQGWGTALKPAWEPIIVAMKPFEGTYAENAQKWGVAGLNIDGGRIGTEPITVHGNGNVWTAAGRAGLPRIPTTNLGRWPANLLLDEESGKLIGKESRFFKVCESDEVCPICGREELCKSSSVSNVVESLRIIQATIPDIVLSDVLTTLAVQYAPNVKSAGNLCDSCAISIAVALAGIKTLAFNELTLQAILAYTGESTSSILIQNLVPFAELLANTDTIPTIQSLSILFGSVSHAITSCTQETRRSEPSRFVYTSKASSSERNAGLEDCEEQDTYTEASVNPNRDIRQQKGKANFHPTVKPVDLMRYLCKLTRTPTGGVVLDPFMGSGTTGIACVLEHRDFIGIEIDEKYAEIAKKRIADMEGPLFEKVSV